MPRRSSKALRGVRRQHLRRIPANELQLLACPGGAPRVCGHAHANICTGYLLMSFNCWRGPAVLQVFAGMPAPTRSCPSLRKECLPYTKDNPREKSEEPKKRKNRRLPNFPGSFPPSIFSAGELNFCVRDGNGWTLALISTNYSIEGLHLQNRTMKK